MIEVEGGEEQGGAPRRRASRPFRAMRKAARRVFSCGPTRLRWPGMPSMSLPALPLPQRSNGVCVRNNKGLLDQLYYQKREEQLKKDIHGENSWQVRLLAFLHSSSVELALSCLLVFDVLVSFIDLYLEPNFPECDIVVENAYCDDGAEASCVERDGITIISFLDALSLSISMIFIAENLAQLAVLGFHEFFSNVFHAVDLLIVATSFGLAVLFLSIGEDDLVGAGVDFELPSNSLTLECRIPRLPQANLAGLLLLARLWRFISIGHNLITTAARKEGEVVESLKSRVEELELLLTSKGIAIPDSHALDCSNRKDVDGDYIAMNDWTIESTLSNMSLGTISSDTVRTELNQARDGLVKARDDFVIGLQELQGETTDVKSQR